ncbi:hypothetical protein HOF92_03410 [bacterium]|jgi:hypothetical protein|nr:hypothetical protein [bacterium]
MNLRILFLCFAFSHLSANDHSNLYQPKSAYKGFWIDVVQGQAEKRLFMSRYTAGAYIKHYLANTNYVSLPGRIRVEGDVISRHGPGVYETYNRDIPVPSLKRNPYRGHLRQDEYFHETSSSSYDRYGNRYSSHRGLY